MLLIDDDEISRYLVRTILGNRCFRYVEAPGAQEGLARVKEMKPDAIILDLNMPDMPGFEVLRRLKADPATAYIPVIIFTSKVLTDEESLSLADAVAVISNESKSRESSIERFAAAFREAGIPFGDETREVHHV